MRSVIIRSCSGRAIAACSTTSSRPSGYRKTFPSICIGRLQPIPRLAPPGCDTFYVLSPVPHLDGDTDWTAASEDYRLTLQHALEREMLPGLSDNIAASHVMTPLDFESRLLSYKGAAFSLEPVLTQSAWFRPHNESEDVKGLYLVGAVRIPERVFPGVLSSARVLDRIVPHVSHFA